MDPHTLSIQLKTLDGQWETIGAGATRYRGVWPENVSYTHDDWGDATCSFNLRRDPGAIHPDLTAFTDCDIWVAGRLAWSGRIQETPTREGDDPVISVQGQGWQYHMDDNQYQKMYVRARLDDFVDYRTLLQLTTGGTQVFYDVQTNGDSIILTAPNGSSVVNGQWCAAVLDLGVGNGAKRVVVSYVSSNNTPNSQVYVLGTDTKDWAGVGTGREDYVSAINNNASAGQTLAGTSTNTHRYITLLHYIGGTTVYGADVFFKFIEVKIFSDTAYESGNESILRSDQVATDALDQATSLLDADRTGISAGAFAGIPEFDTSGYQTPREIWNAANAYENYETKIDARRPIFRPRASAPIYAIGEWSGAEFEDASANSGDEILNRVIVQGTAPSGEQLAIERWQDPTDLGSGAGITQLTNTSFDVDNSGWAPGLGFGTTTRDTSIYHTSPASLRMTTDGPTGRIFVAVTSGSMTFVGGKRYRLSCWMIGHQALNSYRINLELFLSIGGIFTKTYTKTIRGGAPAGQPSNPSDLLVQGRGGALPGYADDFRQFTIDATIPPGVSGSGFWSFRFDAYLSPIAAQNIVYVDDALLGVVNSTIADRRGFVKSRVLPISNSVTTASAARIGDIYLTQHKTTPFTGGFKATGVGGVRRVLGGAAVHPGWLGHDTGQLVRATHVIDPDTGAVGRDERIKTVSYDHDSLTATVSMSENRGGFDALLSRLAAVVGTG